MINIIKDRELIKEIRDYDVILVPITIKNSNGLGFTHDIRRHLPYAMRSVKTNTLYDDPRKMGTCHVVNKRVDINIPTIVFCFISKGRFTPHKISDAVDYDALRSCLELVKDNFSNCKIASTIMGNHVFEGGGDKEKILNIFSDVFTNEDVTLYDYEQEDYRQKEGRIIHEIEDAYSRQEISLEEYYRRKKDYLWDRHIGMYLFSDINKEDYTIRELQKLIKKLKNESDELRLA